MEVQENSRMEEDEIQDTQIEKRIRTMNYSTGERGLLIDLVQKYSRIIEGKRTDGVSLAKKTKAWIKISTEFNAVNTVPREWKKLRKCYESMKKAAKKAASTEKICQKKTGGGNRPPHDVDNNFEKILALIGPAVQPLQNPFDSAADNNLELDNDPILPKPLQCSHCPKLFKYQNVLDIHIRTHTGELPFMCEHCAKRFRSASKLRDHIRTHTGERLHACSTCSKTFLAKRELVDHSFIHTNERKYLCELCSRTFRRSKDLRNHQGKFHSTELNIKTFRCKYCNKILSSPQYLKIHENTHIGNLPIQCHICVFRCDRPSRLTQHLLSHSQERSYHCPTCEKSFKYKGLLSLHIMDHTGERPHKCTTCPKVFKDKEHLKRHEALHSGLNPFKCTFCEDGFPVRKYLNRHLEKHRLGKIPSTPTCPSPPQDHNIIQEEIQSEYQLPTLFEPHEGVSLLSLS